jgi:hypothetical protein
MTSVRNEFRHKLFAGDAPVPPGGKDLPPGGTTPQNPNEPPPDDK